MANLKKRITEAEVEISDWEGKLAAAPDKDEKARYVSLICSTIDTKNVLIAQQTQQGKPALHCSAAAAVPFLRSSAHLLLGCVYIRSCSFLCIYCSQIINGS
jgi:hypothetical protein